MSAGQVFQSDKARRTTSDNCDTHVYFGVFVWMEDLSKGNCIRKIL